MRLPVSPLPAIAAGNGPFLITGVSVDSNACCSLPVAAEPGIFNVPLETDSIQALATRMHELGHLGLGRIGAVPDDTLPRLKSARIHFGWAQFALDVVVNAFMSARGNSEIAQLKLWRGPLPAEIPRWLAAMEFLRCEGLSREMQLRMSLQARAQFDADELCLLCSTARLLRARGAQAALLPAAELTKLLRRLQRKFGPESFDDSHSLLPLQVVHMPCKSGRGVYGSRESGRNQWGTMNVMNPPLTGRCEQTRAKGSRRLVAGYCGPFRFAHRALLPASDGRVFGGKKRNRAGTILIDSSGSMSLSSERLRTLIAHAPAATIALYAGLPENESGLLIVVAQNGRFADIESATSRFGSGNVVDGPALQWLARQLGPRTWVSDGYVTGRGDAPSSHLNRETESIVRAAGIKRVDSLEGC